jgi:CRP/FNR family transcriptional regulator, cyclic AMP receptor protein
MSVPSTDRINRLRAVPIFSELPEGSLGRIAELVTEVSVPAGHVLMQQGQPGSGLLVIEEGTAAVERPAKPRFEVGPGEFLGELALLTEAGVHTARVQARSDIRMLAIGRQDLARLLDEEPRIALAMLSTLAARLAMTLSS